MIKLFRNMRRKLLGENKFSRYLIYAFGEILLVVVGILLAIQFNTWTTKVKEREKQNWYLNNILDDLHYQKQTLDMIEAAYKSEITGAKSILKAYYGKGSFDNIDSLNYYLNTLMYAQFFPNTNNSYREMVSSGQLSLIESQNLSLEVIDFYLFSEDNEQVFQNDIDNIFYPQIYPVISSLVQVDLNDYITEEKDDYLLKSSPASSQLIASRLQNQKTKLALENAIKLKILMLLDQSVIIEETQKGIKELNSLINSELKKNGYNSTQN